MTEEYERAKIEVQLPDILSEKIAEATESGHWCMALCWVDQTTGQVKRHWTTHEFPMEEAKPFGDYVRDEMRRLSSTLPDDPLPQGRFGVADGPNGK